MELPWLCVCVVRWSGVNRNWKWVSSYVMQRLVSTCKLPEDGVLTPKHVGVILILILLYIVAQIWYNNKH